MLHRIVSASIAVSVNHSLVSSIQILSNWEVETVCLNLLNRYQLYLVAVKMQTLTAYVLRARIVQDVVLVLLVHNATDVLKKTTAKVSHALVVMVVRIVVSVPIVKTVTLRLNILALIAIDAPMLVAIATLAVIAGK